MTKRIVSLLPSSTEIICKLGFRNQLVGISHECDYPNSVKGLPVLTKPRFAPQGSSHEINDSVINLLNRGLSVYDVNADLLKSLSPNLIVTQAQCEACAVSLNEVREVVSSWMGKEPDIVSLEPNTLNDVWHDLDRVAEAMDSPESSSNYKAEITERLFILENKNKEIKHKPTVLCFEWIDPIMIAANWVPELVQLAGGTNLLSESGTHSHIFRWEDVIESNPEFLILMPCGYSIDRTLEEVSLLKKKPGWGDLNAVKASQVVIVDGNQYFNRPGPRLLDSAEILAEIFERGVHESRYFGKAWLVADI